MFIEKRNNEQIIHPHVPDPIKEGVGLFGKEILDSQELKIFEEKSRIKSSTVDKKSI